MVFRSPYWHGLWRRLPVEPEGLSQMSVATDIGVLRFLHDILSMIRVWILGKTLLAGSASRE